MALACTVAVLSSSCNITAERRRGMGRRRKEGHLTREGQSRRSSSYVDLEGNISSQYIDGSYV